MNITIENGDLRCPTCGQTQFKHKSESDVVECIACNRALTKQELIEENASEITILSPENNNYLLNEIAKMAKKSFKKKL